MVDTPEKPDGEAVENMNSKELWELINAPEGPYKDGPPEGEYPPELLEKLTANQLRNLVRKHELDETPEMSKADLLEILSDEDHIRLIRKQGENQRKSTSVLHSIDSGSATLIDRYGCLKPFIGFWIIFMVVGFSYRYLTEDGQRRGAAYDKEQAEIKVAELAAKTIDNTEMEAFCSKVRGFRSRHSRAGNRLKQGQVFEEFQDWFKGTQQAESTSFSELRARVRKIFADRAASTAGISFEFCRFEADRSVDFGMWENGITKHTDLYKSIAELGHGSEVLLSGTLRYKGFKTPALSGSSGDTWKGKLSDKFWGFVFDVGDSEDDEEDVLEDFWFEIQIDSIHPAPE